ncbi:molybdopterin biosynthesis protein [Chloroflexota bacterium]
MTIYLNDVPLQVAKEKLEGYLKAFGLWGMLGTEEIPLDKCVAGRVLSESVWAKICSPHYHSAAMDGFAVVASDTEGASQTNPVILPYGSVNGIIKVDYVDTGDPLPDWADAIIPIENVESLGRNEEPAGDIRSPSAIRIRAAVTPWSHVRTMGEDMVASQLVLPGGHTLRPVDLGAIAACGHSSVRVARQPRVAVIPTGSELVPIGDPANAGDIIEYNSLVLAAQVHQWGGIAEQFPIIPDDFDLICEAVTKAARDFDLIMLNAGSSAGSEDYTAKVVQSMGDLLVHGVAVRPGHPVVLGIIHFEENGRKISTPIIGVPGYPVSAALTAEIFVEPLIARWLGHKPFEPATISATLTRKITSPAGDDDYMRVAVGCVGENLLAAPMSRGSGVISSLVHADGITIIPQGSQGLPAGSNVEVRLYRSLEDLENSIVAIGSHDMSLDILAEFLAQNDRRLVSANVGSLGGLVALKRGEAHFAGSHLLDTDTGEYNLSYIHKYLPGIKVKVIAMVGRQQGLLLAKGNPKNINGLEDLTRPDVYLMNRQNGAGTRVLLDFHLNKSGIEWNSIQGYDREEFTHLALAASISSGRADCGLGISAAARALDLDFLPLYQESYQLIVPDEYFDSELFVPLREILADTNFQKKVDAMDGYDVSQMGTIMAELN